MSKLFFEIENYKYNVIINRKNNKNLYIKIDDELNIVISCPYLYTNKMIQKLLNKNTTSILKMIEKQKISINKKSMEKYSLLGKRINITYENCKKEVFDGNNLIVKDDNMLNKWYRKKALEVFKTHLNSLHNSFEESIPYPKLKIRSMKTRWGVCNKKDNSITLNLDLIKKDPKYLNYVIIHELSHFVHFNHSKDFWNVVFKYCPRYKEIRKELK